MVYNDEPRPADHRYVNPPYPVYDNFWYDNESVAYAISGTAACTYELRNYYGTVIATGAVGSAGATLTLGVLPLGWYKLYFIRNTPIASPWFSAGGEITFAVIRSTSPLKARPTPSTNANAGDRLGNGFDAPARGLCGWGPIRHQIRLDSTNYTADKAGALADIAYENSNRNADSARPLKQFVAFPDFDYTSSTQVTNLTNAVQACVAAGVVWFESVNEPNSGLGNDPTLYQASYNTFCDTVHAAHASAKTMGPCNITIGGDYLTDGNPSRYDYQLFTVFGTAAKSDAYSFHNYNYPASNLAEARKVMDTTEAMLNASGMGSKPRFDTEFGSKFASSNAVEENRNQCKLVMLEMHMLEQYGVPKENCYYFYDRSHGFWGFSSWWLNCEGSEVMPTALGPVVRVWSEELWGKTFSARLDFGSEECLWLGTRFTASDTSSVVVVQSSGHVDTRDFAVTGASTITSVDAWGKTTVLNVTSGKITVPINELPTYLRCPIGVTINTIPLDWGIEVFRSQVLTAYSASANTGDVYRVFDGVTNTVAANDWQGTEVPGWVRADFPKLTRFNRVTILCSAPINTTCVLVDFDVQVLQSGSWNTVATALEPTPQKVWTSYKQAGANYIDDWWSRRDAWSFRFSSAVAGDAIRIYIRTTSYGGSPSLESYNQNPGAGIGTQIGLSGPQVPQIREVMCYLNEYDLGKTTGTPVIIQ